ncbi:MAG: hypothetical protein ABS52_12880 [Gemmatimonadetes bacterium SCN 70-22]|nr:MAG: hypothetical protein ABS52_12880 [Gemmatimonadetes bacterium SCN 70-22]
MSRITDPPNVRIQVMEVTPATRPTAITGREVPPMLFRRIIESNARASLIAAVEGYAVSIVAHAALLGGTLVVTHDARPSNVADSFTPVAYFIPRDRIIGSRPKQERITYMSADALGGGAASGAGDETYRKPAPDPGPGLQEMSSKLADDADSAPQADGDSIMTVLQVDTAAARYDDSAAPPYPPKLLEQRIEGSVGIQYVVDTTGYADTSSVVILSATHEEFAKSVRRTLPQMHFRAAVMNGRKVRQLVQQMFAFRIDTSLIAQQKKQDRPEPR